MAVDNTTPPPGSQAGDAKPVAPGEVVRDDEEERDEQHSGENGDGGKGGIVAPGEGGSKQDTGYQGDGEQGSG